MNEQAVLPSHLDGHLADCLQERLAFDISHRSADLCNDHVRIGGLAHIVDEGLNLVRHMRDDLHRTSQEFSVPLLVEDVPVHFTGGQVGILVQILIDESLIVSQIQVGFRTVLGDEYFPVLIRAHGARVNVDIRIQLLSCHLIPSGLQQTSQRSRGNSFAQPGDHASRNENVLLHKTLLTQSSFLF